MADGLIFADLTRLRWQSAPQSKEAKAKLASKTKFTCPECGQNAWAKPDALLLCGQCYEDAEGWLSNRPGCVNHRLCNPSVQYFPFPALTPSSVWV